MFRFSRVLLGLVLLSGLLGTVRADDHHAPALERSVLYQAAASGKARTFVTCVYLAGLTETLRDGGPFTIFVPTDAAFSKVSEEALNNLLKPENQHALADLLKYHVIKGRVLAAEITANPRPRSLAGSPLTIAANGHGVAVNGATVVQTDLVGRNGVVHLIDTLLTPPPDDILATAEKAGKFQILRKALDVTGLTETLQSDGPFTILAPTDEAFAKLGEKTLKGLLKDKAKLTAILKYHVIAGRVTAEQLVTAGTPVTVLQKNVAVRIKGGRLKVNDSMTLDTDIETSNGIIHVIDAVLIPPDSH